MNYSHFDCYQLQWQDTQDFYAVIVDTCKGFEKIYYILKKFSESIRIDRYFQLYCLKK